METLSMSPSMKAEQQENKKYVQLRIEETELLIKATEAPAGTYDNAIKDVGEKIIENVKRDDKK
jgi:hypothetical protein